jgi:hypothetical protein
MYQARDQSSCRQNRGNERLRTAAVVMAAESVAATVLSWGMTVYVNLVGGVPRRSIHNGYRRR